MIPYVLKKYLSRYRSALMYFLAGTPKYLATRLDISTYLVSYGTSCYLLILCNCLKPFLGLISPSAANSGYQFTLVKQYFQSHDHSNTPLDPVAIITSVLVLLISGYTWYVLLIPKERFLGWFGKWLWSMG